MVFPRHAFINNDTKGFGIVYTDYILTIDGNFNDKLYCVDRP